MSRRSTHLLALVALASSFACAVHARPARTLPAPAPKPTPVPAPAPAPAPVPAPTADASGITVQQRATAAAAVATNDPACTGLTAFYWEIGDKAGVLGSGTGGKRASTMNPPKADTILPLASASKWLFATYAVEKQMGSLSAQDLKYLNFTSGYTNLRDCATNATVASCLTEPGMVNGTNGDYVASRDNHFFYNGGHMQMMATSMGLGANDDAALTTNVKAVLGTDLKTLAYAQPQLAGGARASATTYALFLRHLLDGRYRYMPALLGSHPVCTHTNSTDCASATFSPLNESRPGLVNDVSDEAWHYSLGHWVEDDPKVGDGAFSSAGMLGFYPWIDKSRTYYGVLSRTEVVKPTEVPAGQASMRCGRLIRAAWANPSTN